MHWLEKHDPRIDWRGKAIGASRSSVSDRALVSHAPTSARNWGARKECRDAGASEEFLGVAYVLCNSLGTGTAGAVPGRVRQSSPGLRWSLGQRTRLRLLRRWVAPTRWVT
ncbi:hypothetical protein Pcac1_g4798 [Phytophthora cactorum]|nr:hypothetical protein Pcac1_g4798 [Phytophthora cactorum]